MMKGFLLGVAALMLLSVPAKAQICDLVLRDLKLPAKLKTTGKPKMARWEQVDKVLNDLSTALQGQVCQFLFSQVFKTKDEDILFPLTNSVLRLVPEATFQGLPVLNKEGDDLGVFEGRFRFDRAGGTYRSDGYSLYYFQYKDASGEVHPVSRSLLLDSFGTSWASLKGRVAVSTQ